MAERAVDIRIAAPDGRALYRVRSWMTEQASGGKASVLLGRPLPTDVGRILAGKVETFCLGPNDWLLRAEGSEVERLLGDEGIGRHGLALVNLSDGLVTLEVTGSGARDLLSKGCGLDMHPRSFAAGTCARTRFAQLAVLVVCRDGERFELIVARSHARYLQGWLVDAAVDVVPA